MKNGKTLTARALLRMQIAGGGAMITGNRRGGFSTRYECMYIYYVCVIQGVASVQGMIDTHIHAHAHARARTHTHTFKCLCIVGKHLVAQL